MWRTCSILKTWNEQNTALGFGKKTSSEFAEALPYSISEESQTNSTSQHLGDINASFQFVLLPTIRILSNGIVFLCDIN